jgi:hypothetical protein
MSFLKCQLQAEKASQASWGGEKKEGKTIRTRMDKNGTRVGGVERRSMKMQIRLDG